MEIAQFETLVRQRRSVRAFRPDPVPDDVLRQVLADAATAPSWSNTQPFRLALATGATRDRIAAALTAQFDLATQLLAVPESDVDIPLAYPEELQPRRRATGYGLYEVLGIARADRAARDEQMRRNFEFFGAPAAVFVFVHAGLGLYSALDAGFMLQTLALSAKARGLGTCAQGALAMWSAPVRAEFTVPDEYLLLCGVSLGYPTDDAVNSYDPGRKTLEEILLQAR